MFGVPSRCCGSSRGSSMKWVLVVVLGGWFESTNEYGAPLMVGVNGRVAKKPSNSLSAERTKPYSRFQLSSFPMCSVLCSGTVFR